MNRASQAATPEQAPVKRAPEPATAHNKTRALIYLRHYPAAGLRRLPLLDRDRGDGREDSPSGPTADRDAERSRSGVQAGRVRDRRRRYDPRLAAGRARGPGDYHLFPRAISLAEGIARSRRRAMAARVRRPSLRFAQSRRERPVPNRPRLPRKARRESGGQVPAREGRRARPP